ncbi:Voltage-gated Ion Channel (VIC) Superfamily [Achlya hypogyna]|uniref:Voltage-gated Ion Channel (VIC) Superfamily n=1 Tax=Achlya hypogyna TaxID=1202772 RepID=A0A1V9Z558_ACHHY|nr:Voltage-gated Ion Channel (VIC) Superfamily [Achlya hypogyna]
MIFIRPFDSPSRETVGGPLERRGSAMAPLFDKASSSKTFREIKKVQRISLGCLTTKNPIRRACIKIFQSPWFDRVVIFVVCFNTVILGLVDYSHAWAEGPNPNIGYNGFIEKFNAISLYFFVSEMVIKIIAMGFVFGEGAYLGNNWNRLDFVIVCSGMLNWINFRVGFIRVLRVLRPLRTLHSFPGLKILTNSLLSSLPALGNVVILLSFSYIVFAILGMEIWRGAFHARCRITPYPIALPFNVSNAPVGSYPVNASFLSEVIAHPEWFRCNKSDGSLIEVNDTWSTPLGCFWPLDTALDSSVTPMFCTPPESVGRTCKTNNWCGSDFDPNGNPRFLNIAGPGWSFSIMNEATFTPVLNFGFTNFDNLGNSFMIILQVVTASGWMALTEMTQWVGDAAVAAIYFNALLFFGMCFLLQLNMAVLCSEFDKAKATQEKLAEAKEAQLLSEMARMQSHSLSAIKSQGKPVQQKVALNTPVASHNVGDIVVGTASSRHIAAFRVAAHKLVIKDDFRRFGLVVTIANVFVMSLNHTNPSHEFVYNTEVVNFVFMVYFVGESSLKMIGLGLRAFWRDKFNRFDLLTVLFGIIEFATNPPTFIDGTPGGAGAFTSFRALRALKIARSWKGLNKLLTAIMKSFSEILNFIFFLVIFCYIFALLGMEIFATKYQFDQNNYALPYNTTNPAAQLHRSNYDSITWAVFTVFQVITYDNFPSVTYDGWISVGWASPVYHASIIVFGVWIVMNMFLAILVGACMDDDDEDADRSVLDDADADTEEYPPGRLLRHVRRAKRAMFQLVRLLDATVYDPLVEEKKMHAKLYLNKGSSLFVFAPDNPVRMGCVFLLKRWEWSWFISLAVFVSCIFTAIDTPLLDPNSDLGQSIAISNQVWAILFSVELIVTVIAKGLIFGKDAYVKDSWRILDGFIVTVSVLPYMIGGGNAALSALRSLRGLRALRPLRVINKLPQLKIVVNTVFRCIPSIINALVFFVFVLFIFGLMGISLFKGAFNTCSISPYTYTQGTGTPVFPPWFPSDYAGDFKTNMTTIDTMTYPVSWSAMSPAQRAPLTPVWNTTGCGPFTDDYVPTSKEICLCFATANGTAWNPVVPQKFDNILWAVGGLYELTTMEAWSLAAMAGVDATGQDMQPIVNNNQWMIVWWWLYMIVCAWFVTNLFIGILCDSFCRESYGAVVTEEQIKWIKLQKKVLALSPQVYYPVPHHKFRAFCYKIMHYKYTEYGVTACIFLNVLTMCMDQYGDSLEFQNGLNICNYFFTGIFTVEAILKITAFGFAYFEDSWNRFDFTIVNLTIVSIILPYVTKAVTLGSVITVVRVFRVGRALRLIKKAKTMKNLIDTLIVSLPAVINVTSLLMLLFYIYSALAVQFFAKVAFDSSLITQYQNFRNFFHALQALIGFSTGENWDNFTWEIYNTAPASNPTCADRSFNGSMCGFNDTDLYNCIPLDGCGSWGIVPFMYSMYLIIGYLGMNLFSGIVIDAIGDSSADCPINANTLADFADRWADFDPRGSGLITAEELADFLYTVYPPFGFRSVPGFTRRRVVIAIGKLDIPIYDNFYVHFKDVPRALVTRVLAEGDEMKHEEINRLMDQMGITKQFEELWHRRRGKKQKERLLQREVGPVKEYSASVVIQRFLTKSKLQRQYARSTNSRRIVTGNSNPNLAADAQPPVGEDETQDVAPGEAPDGIESSSNRRDMNLESMEGPDVAGDATSTPGPPSPAVNSKSTNAIFPRLKQKTEGMSDGDAVNMADTEKRGAADASGEGRSDVRVHPLVLMNLCDHWTRAQGMGKQVMGALFGIQKGRNIEVMDSFELPTAAELQASDSPTTLKTFLTQRTEQFAKVFPGFEFLGWYAVQDKIQQSDLTTHRTLMEFNESPLFLVLDPTPPPTTKGENVKVKLPLSLYESELHVLNNTPTMLFVKTQFKVHTTESEGIALDHISKVAPSGAATESSLHGGLGSMRDAIQMLDKQLGVLRAYLEATKRGDIPVDHALLRQVASICQQLPAMRSDLFASTFSQEFNDTLLVTYLATITKGITCTNAVLDKFAMTQDRQHPRVPLL